MKKLFIYGCAALFALTGCSKQEEKKDDTQQMLEQQAALAEATREELEQALTERDELLDLIGEINSSISEIQSVERIVTVQGVGEGSQKTEIANNLSSIKSTLAERRKQLSDLENKLKDSKLANDKLLGTIETLKKQIDEQTDQIERLTAELNAAKVRINELDEQVASLETTVTDVKKERDEAQQEAIQQADLANECYYAIGTNKELKAHGIIESGFLRKTKIMQGDFDQTFFVKADKRNLRTIPLHSKKAKIVTTSQPANSYEFTDVNGQKVLTIINPAAFWGTSNYVVIQID